MRTCLLSAIATLAFLSSPLSGQVASYTYYGTGCYYNPPFSVVGVPKPGSTITIRTYGSYYSYFSRAERVLISGLSDAWLGSAKLPYQLPGFCGPFLTSIEIYQPVPSTTGPRTMVSMPFPIPNSASLLGLSFYQQVGEIVRSCSKMGCGPAQVSLSRGGHGVVGK